MKLSTFTVIVSLFALLVYSLYFAALLGILQDVHDKLFDPFAPRWQVQRSTRR